MVPPPNNDVLKLNPVKHEFVLKHPKFNDDNPLKHVFVPVKQPVLPKYPNPPQNNTKMIISAIDKIVQAIFVLIA